MISSIRLQHFRSYTDESFEFEPGVNIVVGPNAAGKTNLLEAVLVLARGTSYKIRDTGLVQHGAPWARLDGFFEDHSRVMKLEPSDDIVTKTFLIDDQPYKRLSLNKSLPVVLFEPNQLQLLTRGPNQRREYLDDLLERSVHGYGTLLRSYKRSLAQRNALLKRSQSSPYDQLFVWNLRISELGGKIASTRLTLIDNLNKELSDTYSKIAGRKTKLLAKYESPFAPDQYSSLLLAKLESSTELDLMRGFTSSGPHREDIVFYLDGQPLAATASRGETRSLLLGLKTFELKLLRIATNQQPIFLLDDVFSELDSARRRTLVEYLGDHQTIITTTDADIVVKYFTKSYNVLPLTKQTSKKN